jgi:hypothetical protein
MIHYHGGPITGEIGTAIELWRARHAMISFNRFWLDHQEQIAVAVEMAQSFALDNGAYSTWKAGERPDWESYADFLEQWGRHPGCDFALIPDVVEGSEKDNEKLVEWWLGKRRPCQGVPVWHLHESLLRLRQLSLFWPRVALGSSGPYAKVGTNKWWNRIGGAMRTVCDEQGRPRCRLHGLRMLNPTVFSHIPLASADSTNVARCIGRDRDWRGWYTPQSHAVRALVLADRIEKHASAAAWNGSKSFEENLELFG